MHYKMALLRRFEEKSAEEYTRGKIGGFMHLYIGQEAVGIGAITALRADDKILSSYREHGHAIAKGMEPRAERKNLPAKKSERTPQGNLPPFAKGKSRLAAEPGEQGQGKRRPSRTRGKRRRERGSECRHERACQRLERKGETLILPPDDAPAELAEIDFGKTPRADFLGNRPVHEHGL